MTPTRPTGKDGRGEYTHLLLFGTPQLLSYLSQREDVLELPGQAPTRVDWVIGRDLPERDTPLRAAEEGTPPPAFPFSLARLQVPLESQVAFVAAARFGLRPRGLLAVAPDLPVTPTGSGNATAVPRTGFTANEDVLGPIESEFKGLRSSWHRHSRQVRLAVIDTGCASPCSPNVVVPQDVMTSRPAWGDGDGHGTLVAGVCARLAGEAVSVMPYRIMQESRGRVSTLMKAMHDAVIRERVDVVNVSQAIEFPVPSHKCLTCGSFSFEDELLRDARVFLEMSIRTLASQAVIVAAAGNRPYYDYMALPAALPEVVAACASSGGRASPVGVWRKPEGPAVFAPGGTARKPFGFGSTTPAFGTSFSAAIVSAAASLHMATFPCGRPENPTIASVVQRLRECGTPMAAPIGSVRVTPATTDPSILNNVRASCLDQCAAFHDKSIYRAIFRGRTL